MARNDVIRVYAANTTAAEKGRRKQISAEAELAVKREADGLSRLWDPNNTSAEAVSRRDGPIKSLTPDVVAMIATGKPVEWGLRAVGTVAKGLLRRLPKAGMPSGKPVPFGRPVQTTVSADDLARFNGVKEELADWYARRASVIENAAKDTGTSDTLDGFLSGIRGSKLVDTSGRETALSAFRSGGKPGDTAGLYRTTGDDILHSTTGDVAIEKSMRNASMKGVVYHEVGGHGATRGSKATALLKAARENNESASALKSVMDNPSSTAAEIAAAGKAREAGFNSYMKTLKSEGSSGEMVKLIREKYGVPVKDPEYWDRPDEIVGRLFDLRAYKGIRPDTKWTPNIVQSFRRSGALKKHALDHWSDEALAELANRVPMVAAPLAASEIVDRQQAAKGGSNDRSRMANFLATDKVPNTIFGIPVVSRKEDYTERDIEFFKEHPEAGGYYDMEDGNEDTSSAEEVPAQGLGEVQPGEPAGEGVPQMAEKAGKTYDTVIPKEREAEYQAWKMKHAPNDSGYDYDLRGAFLEGFLPDPKTGHWPDKYKKPNHPTFSVESKYAVGADANLAGTWNGETYVPNPNAVRELWNRAVKSTGNLDGMARVFAAMSGESSLNQRGATAEQISNGHLARLVVHANETDRYNGNPANSGKRTVTDTTNRTSHVLSKYKWGTGPGSNWFDASRMEPRFDLINRDPVSVETAKALILNGARFLNGDLNGTDWLPSDAVSYGDGPKGLMPDREEIRPGENRIGPMPSGFRIGRKKGVK